MKIQPKSVYNIGRDDLTGIEVLNCTLHCCECTKASQCEQDDVPSCMPWLWRCAKRDEQQVGSISSAVRAGFALCSGQGCMQCKCIVPLSPAGGTATADWRAADSSGAGTWLSPKGTWSATELQEHSLLLTNNGSNARIEVAGPGASPHENISCRSRLQLFIHDAGAAVLAVGHNEQDQVVMHLWRHVAGTHTQQHQCNPWLQLPTLPSSRSSTQGLQQAAAASSTHAVFVQQHFGGLQLYVARTVTHTAGAVLLCVLQQPVLDVCCGTTQQPQHSMPTTSCWHSMLISLPGVTERNSLQHILESEEQQQTWKLTGQVELTDEPATAPEGSAAVTAAAVKELLTKSSRAIASVKLSWHPQGSHLAVAVSACEGGSWVVLCSQGSREVQECCWNHLLDKKATSLLHRGPCHISSMAWLSPDRDVLAVIDTHGRLCLLSGGAFERLQLVDTAGMTITFKPVIQLQFSMLLAATSGSQTAAAALTQHFQLATVPTEEQTSAESMDGLNKLAIWNGAQLLVCSLYPGVDPSQRRINQTVNSRTLLLYGTASALRLASHHKRHQPEPEEKGMKLEVRQPEAVGGDIAAGALIPGRPIAISPDTSSGGATVGIPAEGVSVILSPLIDSQSCSVQQQHELKPADTTSAAVTSEHSGQQLEQKLASLPQLLCDGDVAFVAGRWQECETIYRQGLPLTAGHIMSVLFCQYRVQEALGLLRQLLADTLQAVAAQQVAEQSASAAGVTVINTAAGGAIGHTAAEAVSAVGLPDLQPLQVLHLGVQLAAALSGLTADMLLAAVSGCAGCGAAGTGSRAATGPSLPCIFPTPLHWSSWVKRHISEQGGITDPCIWQLTAGMAVELMPISVLADLAQQVNRKQLSSTALMVQETAKHAVARAAGLLLLSEVLAAEAEGVPLPQDLPHLLTEAIANTRLPTDAATTGSAGASAALEVAAGGVGMWQQAAVLAVTCGAILQRVQLQAHMTEVSDEAARFALWRQVAAHRLAPVSVLAQQAAAVTATAASLWPADYASLSQFTSKVLGLLCNYMALRVLAVSVLPLPREAGNHSWSNLQQVVQLLLAQALSAAMPSAVAAWQASLGSGVVDQLETLSHSTASDKETHRKAYAAATRAVWANSGVKQLLQLLAALCLETDKEVGSEPFAARLAAAGAPLTAEAWSKHLHQHLVDAGVADEPEAQQQQQWEGGPPSPAALAELSCQCDLLALSSAVLLVAQVALGLSSTDLVHRIKQQWDKMAADAAMPSSSRVQLPCQGRSQALQIEEEVSADEALALITNIAWLMHCREQVAAGQPEDVAGWVVCMAAANGLHKQQNVQQGLLTVLAAADCQVTQQDLQHLQDVLGGCCGGVLPRTADQLKKLKVLKRPDNQYQQYHNKRVEFLQQLQAMASATGSRSSGLLATSTGCWLQEALEITVKRGPGYLQSRRQAVPALQDCLIHPLADGPEPSATSAYLALTAVLLGSSASSSGSKAGGLLQPNATAASVPGVEISAAQGDKKPAADDEVMTSSIRIDVFADGDEDSAVAPAAADHAAASLHAAAAAWQKEHINVLQDQHLMQDVRQALGGPRRWSIGSFFAGLGSPRPERVSLMQSMNPSEFNDFLLPSNSFSAAQQQYPPASASPEANAARSSRLSGAAADLRLSSTSQSAAGAPRQLLSPRTIMSPNRSLHQWTNPLATLELPSLESFYGVYSPTESAFCESAPVSPSKSLPAGFGLSPPRSQLLHGHVSPTASQPLQLQRVVSAAAGSSAPGSLSSSRLASPRSPRSSLPPEGTLGAAGQLSISTSFMQHYSPLQHYQSLRQQRLLTSQSSRVFRARSLSRAHSGDTWERRSSIGGAIDAIAHRPPAQVPGDLPAVATWGSVEPAGLLQTQLSEVSEMTGGDSPVPAAAVSATVAEVPVSAAFSQIAGHEVLPSMNSSILPNPCSACHPSQTEVLEHGGEKQETLPASPAASLAEGNSSNHSEDTEQAQVTASVELASQQAQQQGRSTQPVPVSTAAKAMIAHTDKVTRGTGYHSRSSPRAALLNASPRAGPTTYSGSPRAVKVTRNPTSPHAARPYSAADSPRTTQQQTQQAQSGTQLTSSQPGHPVTKPTGQHQQRVAHQTLHQAQQQPHTRSSVAAEKEPVPSSSVGIPGKRGTGYAAHAAHSKSRHGRPVGEAEEHHGGLLEQQMQVHPASVRGECGSSSNGTTKQSSLGKRWLSRLRRACRWPGSECDRSQPGLSRIPAGPMAEGVEGAAESPAALAISQCSSNSPHAVVDTTAGPVTTAAVEAAALRADVPSSHSGSPKPKVDENTSEHLGALQQQHLDDLLKAHLPEFISVLTKGISPVQESSYVGSSGPSPETQTGVQSEDSPALSLQRSFSMVELHDRTAFSSTAEAAAAKLGRLRASAGDVTSLLRSQPAEWSQNSSSGCISGGSVSVQQQHRLAAHSQFEVTADAPLDRDSSAVEAAMPVPTSLQVSVAARVHVPALVAACDLAFYTPLELGIPSHAAAAGLAANPQYSTTAGPIPVAEGVESNVSDNMPSSPRSCGSSSWTAAQLLQHQQQQQEASAQHQHAGLQREADGGFRRRASLENIPSMMERVRQLLASLQTRAVATSGLEMSAGNLCLDQSATPLDQAAAAAAEQYLNALAQGVGVDASSNAATAAVEELSDLDMSEFMATYSPAGTSRRISRTSSTNSTPRHPSSGAGHSQRLLAAAAAVGAMSHNPLQGTGAQRPMDSNSHSPQADSSAPDLEGFWVDSGVFNGPGTRAISRQVSAHNTQHQRRSTAEGAAAPMSLLGATKVLGATDAAVPAESAAATVSSAPGELDPSAVGSQHVRSPASSQKAILLHGPSRLSLQTAAPTQSEDTVQQASQGSRQQQQQVEQLVVQGPMIATQPATQAAALNAVSMHQSPVMMHAAANAAESAAVSEVSVQQMQKLQLAVEPADLGVEAVQSQQSGTQQQKQHTELAQQQQGPKEPKERGSLKRMLFGKLGKSQDGGSIGMLESASIRQEEQHAEAQHSSTGSQLASEQPQQTASPPKWGFFSIFGRTSHSGSRGPSESGSPPHQRQLYLQAAAQKLQQQDSPAVGKLSPRMFAMFQRSSGSDAQRGQRKAGQQDEAPVAAAAAAASDVGSDFGDVSMICQVASCPVSPLHGTAGAGDMVPCNTPLDEGVLHQQQQQDVVHGAANKVPPVEMSASNPAPAPAHTVRSSTFAATDLRCQQPPQQTQQQQRLQQAATAILNPPVPPPPPAAVPAPAAAAVVAPGSPVVQVLANSMQRIATALEEFLCEHSPASRTPPGTAKSKAVDRSTLRPTSAVQEERPAVGWSATTPLQRRSAPVGQQVETTWSPAALAAKARMLRSTAASKAPSTQVQQQVRQHSAAPLQVATMSANKREPSAAAAAASGTAAAVAYEPEELCSRVTGWLHPDQFERGHTQLPGVQQRNANTNHPQQQQEEQVGVPLAEGRTFADDGVVRSIGNTATPPAGITSLDTFVLLASEAVGVDFLPHSLQPNNPVANARRHHVPQDDQQPRHGGLGTSHRVHVEAAVTMNQPADPGAASASAHTPAVGGRSDVSSSPLPRRSWQRINSVSPTVQQHPRLWRPASLRVHRTRVGTPTAAPAASVSPSRAADAASLPQPFHLNADYTSNFSRFCGVSAAAPHAGPTPSRMPVPSLGTRCPVCDSATTASAGSAKCLVAAADVKLIHRGMEHSIRLLRPTHLQEELHGLHRGPHQQQHQSSGIVQRPTQPQGCGSRAAGASVDDICLQYSRPAATYHSCESDLTIEPKLVRFPVAAVKANLLQPPVLQQVRTLGGQPHFPERQAGELMSLTGRQQPEQLWSNRPLVQQQQLPEQRQRVRAPWEVAGRTQGTTSPSPESALTAGTRAARLINTLLEPKDQPAATQAGTAAAAQQPPLPLQPVQHHVTTVDGQVIGSPTVPANSGTVPADLQPPSSSMPAAAPQPAWAAHQQQPHRNPAHSPRKNIGLHKKWVALQQLKARNRSRKPPNGTAGRQSVQQQQQRTAESSTPADRLVEQLQQLMQQPGVADTNGDVQKAAYRQTDSYTRHYLDAAAATALQGVDPHPRSTPAQQQPQHHQQQQEGSGLPNPEDSISFSKLEAGSPGPGLLGTPVTTAAVQTEDSGDKQQEEEQSLLLPRMLSRAPLVDAEVQAGPLLQQQQLGVAADADPTTAALVAEEQKLVQLQRQPAAGTSIPELPGCGQQGDPGPEQTKQQQPYVLQPQQPWSPASILALAAAAGAGAAAAVHSTSPMRAVAAATAGQASAPVSLPALAVADQQPKQEKSVAELARLILGAFESAGGVIAPDRNALGALGHKDSSVAAASPDDWQQQQPQQSDVLPNPLAGLAAPQYLSVVDFTPPFLDNSTADLQQDELQQHDQQQYADEQQHTQEQYTLMSFSTNAQPHHGCCFAACPQRIPSPSFKGSPTITRKISPPKGWHRPQVQGTTSSSRRSEFKQAQVTVTTSSKKVSGSAGKRSSQQQQQRPSSKRVGVDTRSHRHQYHHHNARHQHDQQGSPSGSHQQQQPGPWGVPGIGATSSIGVVTPPISRRTSSKLQELRQSRLSVLQQQQLQPQQQGASDWARQQTRQLAHLWQQWNRLQGQQHRDQQRQLRSQPQHADENSDPHGAHYAGTSENQQHKGGQQQQQQGGTSGTASAAISGGVDALPPVYMVEKYTEHEDAAAAAAATETAYALVPDDTANAAAAAAVSAATAAGQDVGAQVPFKEPFSQERLQVEAAYARAAAARAAAKAAAQRAAAARSRRLRAELTDLSKMLSEVDSLAAQMEAEGAEAAAMIQQYACSMGATASSCKVAHQH